MLDGTATTDEAFISALERAKFLSAAGLKDVPALQEVFERYPEIGSPEAVDRALAVFAESKSANDKHIARSYVEWQVDMNAGRQLAPYAERVRRWEHEAKIGLDGRELPYLQFHSALASATSRVDRRRLYAARSAVVARELAPLRMQQVERERELFERLKLAADYIETCELLSATRLRHLASEAEGFLRDTALMWKELQDERCRDIVGDEGANCDWTDIQLIFGGMTAGSAFPKEHMHRAVFMHLETMGLEPTANGRILLDAEDRHGKSPRAEYFAVRVPDEILVVLQPQSGFQGWQALLHEMGHAQHYAHIEPDLPFAARYLGDKSISEGCAFLQHNLAYEPKWLRQYAGMKADEVRRFMRSAAFFEFLMIRRYCAKLVFELERSSRTRGEWSSDEVVRLYADLMREGTGFFYEGAGAFVDVDERTFASALYLRGWQSQARLRDELRKTFGSEWWRDAGSGEWLRSQIWAWGYQETADELVRRSCGTNLSFDPLVGRLEEMLNS